MSITKIEPVTWNLTVYQGDHFPFNFRIAVGGVNVDLVEAEAEVRAQIRATEADSTILADFGVVDLGTDGLVRLLLTPVQTAALPISGGKWDCEVTLDGVVRTYFKGAVVVVPEVTR